MKQLNWYQIFGQTHTIPDGSTVTPTDDVQILLNCANIWDKAYTTIADLLSDTTSLLAVIVDNNAINYLVRSTTFASSVTADATAMTDIGGDNYASNTLLGDSTWCTAICNSTYFESVLNVKVPTMTSNTTPSGVVSVSGYHPSYPAYYQAFNPVTTQFWVSADNTTNQWIQYKFDEAVKIKCMTYEATFVIGGVDYARTASLTLKGGADGNTFSYAQTFTGVPAGSLQKLVVNNNDEYAYWRLVVNGFNMHYNADNCLVCILNFYGRKDV